MFSTKQKDQRKEKMTDQMALTYSSRNTMGMGVKKANRSQTRNINQKKFKEQGKQQNVEIK